MEKPRDDRLLIGLHGKTEYLFDGSWECAVACTGFREALVAASSSRMGQQKSPAKMEQPFSVRVFA